MYKNRAFKTGYLAAEPIYVDPLPGAVNAGNVPETTVPVEMPPAPPAPPPATPPTTEPTEEAATVESQNPTVDSKPLGGVLPWVLAIGVVGFLFLRR